MEEKRSKLFPEKRRVPGRKAKLVVFFGLMGLLWSSKKL
jgi:hypothetical protein